ncbi:MAG: Mov34/MPN/PAD-1 family protein [Thermomicrobiales bacterium]
MRPPALPNPRAVEDVPPAGLILDRSTHDRIIAHLRAGLPNEACGLLATGNGAEGSMVGGAEWTMHFYPGANIDGSPSRYTIDPVELFAAFRDMEAHGWRLGAIVHSHPVSPPTPSPTDLREAYYPGALMLIVSFRTGQPEMRAWRVEAGSPPSTVVEAPVFVMERGSRGGR